MQTILSVNQSEQVKEQYKGSSNLDIRIKLHQKYSKNKMGISNWNFSIYEIEEGMNVLELGCGTGSLWIDHFDVVIANYMLYHVPNLEKGISEVKRVLKSGGHFYAATSSEKGIMETVVEMLKLDYQYYNPFSLENGEEKLAPFFDYVERKIYEDSLAENSKLGFDFAKYQDEFKEFIKEKFPEGNYHIERDGYLFICGDRA